METNFTDYNPEELVGKLVLLEWSRIGKSGSIHRISKVNKTSFKLEGDDGSYNIRNGYMRASLSRGTHCRCKLITEEQAAILRQEWRTKKEMFKMKEAIKGKLEECSYDDLKKIMEVLKIA